MTLAYAVTLAMVGGAAADTFDGVYRGTQRTTLNNASSECVGINNDHAVIEIRNSHFVRAWGQATLSVDVAPNGSFQATQTVSTGRSLRVAQIKGQITGSSLEADVGTNLCGAHISLKKM